MWTRGHPRDPHAALVGDDLTRHDTLRALLGPDRLRVYSDAGRGFRLEGTLRLRLEPSARPATERRAKQVAGGVSGMGAAGTAIAGPRSAATPFESAAVSSNPGS